MTDIERMARESGLHRAGNLWYSLDTGSNHENADVAHEDLARFAALVAAAERERCAKVCEAQYNGADWIDGVTVANKCASAIRAGGTQ